MGGGGKAIGEVGLKMKRGDRGQRRVDSDGEGDEKELEVESRLGLSTERHYN